MKFIYKAASLDGKLIEGEMDARDKDEAAFFLKNKNYIPVILKEKSDKIFSLSSFMKKRQSTNDLVLFTRQLSSMLTAGLTLMQSLTILQEQLEDNSLSPIVNYLITQVSEGKSLAEAMAHYPKLFSPVYLSLIRAGETSGFLDKILDRLANNLEKSQKLRSTISSALLYPIIIVILMVVVMGLMMVFVIPQLTSLYANLGIDLPLPTRIVVGVSNFTINFWPLVIGVVVLIIFGYNRWMKTETGRLIRDQVVIKIPVFGRLVVLSLLTEFVRTLGLLIGAGTLVVESLQEGADVAGNLVYKNAILDIADRVEKGIGIGDAMSTYPIFPPIMVQMVRIGEQTGKLDESLLKVSEYFEREVETGVKGLTTAIEPFIMIILGIGVAFLIISVITPIYSLTSSIQ